MFIRIDRLCDNSDFWRNKRQIGFSPTGARRERCLRLVGRRRKHFFFSIFWLIFFFFLNFIILFKTSSNIWKKKLEYQQIFLFSNIVYNFKNVLEFQKMIMFLKNLFPNLRIYYVSKKFIIFFKSTPFVICVHNFHKQLRIC